MQILERIEFGLDYCFVASLKKVCYLLYFKCQVVFSDTLFGVPRNFSNLKISKILIFFFYSTPPPPQQWLSNFESIISGAVLNAVQTEKAGCFCAWPTFSFLVFTSLSFITVRGHRQWKELERSKRYCGNLCPCIDPMYVAPLRPYLSLERINFFPGYLAGLDPKEGLPPWSWRQARECPGHSLPFCAPCLGLK